VAVSRGAPGGRRGRGVVLGLVIGIVGTVLATLFVGGPVAIAHRQNSFLERIYGDFAVEMAARTQAGSATNPLAGDRRALIVGRNAFTGSCAQCHGLSGDGKGEFGQATFPPATDLRARDTQEKSDAQLFWIVKNGLSFTGMPAFGEQYKDQDIWSMVSYIRSLGGGQPTAALQIPTPSAEQLAMADPAGDAVHRGAAVYMAQGCASCHGVTGEAPGDLALRPRERELSEATRQGRRGMPAYGPGQVTDAQLADLSAYADTFPDRPRGRG
jgi:mono/diheme cytochrome c family protein